MSAALRTAHAGEVNILSIGDVHFGARGIKSAELAIQMSALLEEVVDSANIDLIVVDGDWFDRGLALTSRDATHGIGTLFVLMGMCKRAGKVRSDTTQIRVLTGTRSHDLDQLETLSSAADLLDDYAARFHSKVAVEDWDVRGRDLRILYIPEEYPADMREHYAETVFNAPDGHYDLIFMHGTISTQAHSSQVLASERQHPSAPVWNEEDLARICKGPILAGHIHKKCDWRNKIFYHSSFTRLAFGEQDDPKGFNFAHLDKDGGYHVQQIENKRAPLKDTIVAAKGVPPEELVRRAMAWREDVNEARRLAFGTALRVELPDEYLEAHPEARTLFADLRTDNKWMSVKASGLVIPAEEEEKGASDKYAYLESGHVDPAGTLRRYIREETGADFQEPEIKEAISE